MAKILAVDDDSCILELYREIFSKAGFEIQTADDANSAMMRYQEFRPDLVVLDVDMPFGGGQKVFESLRNTLQSRTPIIFSTAIPEAVQTQAKASGISVLKKPVNPEILLAEVGKFIKPEKKSSCTAKVLAIDDELIFLEFYKQTLGAAGFEVQTAEDSAAAVNKFQEFKPDIILLDVGLPGGGGEKVYKRLRDLLMVNTPVIFITGMPESVERFSHDSNVSILKKPVNPVMLMNEIKKILKIP